MFDTTVGKFPTYSEIMEGSLFLHFRGKPRSRVVWKNGKRLSSCNVIINENGRDYVVSTYYKDGKPVNNYTYFTFHLCQFSHFSDFKLWFQQSMGTYWQELWSFSSIVRLDACFETNDFTFDYLFKSMRRRCARLKSNKVYGGACES